MSHAAAGAAGSTLALEESGVQHTGSAGAGGGRSAPAAAVEVLATCGGERHSRAAGRVVAPDARLVERIVVAAEGYHHRQQCTGLSAHCGSTQRAVVAGGGDVAAEHSAAEPERGSDGAVLVYGLVKPAGIHTARSAT